MTWIIFLCILLNILCDKICNSYDTCTLYPMQMFYNLGLFWKMYEFSVRFIHSVVFWKMDKFDVQVFHEFRHLLKIDKFDVQALYKLSLFLKNR
jgi:hypothetical protein